MVAFQHILVPVDFSGASERALDLALSLASKFEAKLTLLHVTWLPPYYYAAYAEGLAWPTDELDNLARQKLDATVTKVRAVSPRVEGALAAGEPWEKILEATKERSADLIVMGTHGRRGLAHVFLGSVAEKVVRLSSVPVLTASAATSPKGHEVP